MIATASMNQLFFASLGSVRRFSSVLGRLSNQGSSRTLCPVRRDINILTPVEAACEPVILRHSVIKRVEDILHHKFSDRSLLAQALTHRSVVNPTTSCTAFYEDSEAGLVEISRNNERLELLGDRVFGLLVAHALYERDTSSSEGAMSAMSHVLVSRRNADAYSQYVY